MKKALALSVMLLAFAASGVHSAPKPEITIMLRVQAVGADQSVRFSGAYQFGDGAKVTEVKDEITPFGVTMKANVLKADLRKVDGKADLDVEAVEFIDGRQVNEVKGTGQGIDVNVWPEGDDLKMAVSSKE